MNKMKRIVASTLALAVIVPSIAFAAPGDVHLVEGGLYKKAGDMLLSGESQEEVMINPQKYYYEGKDSKLYNFDIANQTFADSGKDLDATLDALTTKEHDAVVEAEEELKVESVSAINATTLLVTFEGMEPVEIELDEALVHGQTEVTFVYDEVEYTAELDEAYVDPAVVEAEELAAAKETAKAELDEYVDAAEYEVNAEALATAIAEGKAAVEAAETIEEVEAAVVAAKEAIDAIETDEEIAVREAEEAAAELAAAKEDAIAELDEYVDAAEYETNAEALATAIAEGKEAVEAAETTEEVEAAVAAAQEAIDAIETDAEIVAREEAAAAELAEAKETAKAELDEYVDAAEYEVNAEALEAAITEGKEAVDAAETTEDVDAAVVAAKEAIDAIETDEEIAVREAEEALVEATEAVVVAEESLLEADLADARELVDALEDSDEKVLLGARLDSLQLKLNGIRDAVNNATTEIQLDRALNVKPFVDYDVANITLYLAQNTGAFTTIADIQEDVIDAVNATAEAGELTTLVTTATNAVIAAEADPDGDVAAPGTGTLIAAAQEAIDALPAEITEAQATAAGTVVTIKADLQERLEDVKKVAPVVAATNQIELLPALENNFDRVNEDLIATYETDLLVTDITVVAIQGKIDAANLLAAQTAVTTAEGSLLAADVATAQVLVTNLPEDVAPATIKADLQEDLDVVTALIAVADATTEAELLAALENEVLALTVVNPEAIADYKTLVDGGADITTATNVQTNVITAGNTAALATAVSDVETNFQTYDATLAADQADALEELNRLADVSDLDKETIDAELIEQYIVAIDADLTGGSATITGADTAKVTAIQALIEAENDVKDETLRLAAVNAATTPAEMRTALTVVAVAESVADYINLSSQAKLEVAELVLVTRNAITTPVADEFAATGNVTTAIGTSSAGAIKARADLLGGINGATADIATMKGALDTYAYDAYVNLDEADKVAVAEAFLAAFPYDDDASSYVNYTTLADINADIDAAIAAQ